MKRFALVILLLFGFLFSTDIKALAAYFGPTWGNKDEIVVYIPEGNKYSETMKEAFQKWQKCTNDKLKFTFVPADAENPLNSDVIVVFSDQVDGTDGDVGSYSTIVQGGLIVKANITIATESKQNFSDKLIYVTMLHEIGHILGLQDTNRNLGIMHSPVGEKQDIITNDIVKLYRYNNWSTIENRINILR